MVGTMVDGLAWTSRAVDRGIGGVIEGGTRHRMTAIAGLLALLAWNLRPAAVEPRSSVVERPVDIGRVAA